jgi:hypothetical protein
MTDAGSPLTRPCPHPSKQPGHFFFFLAKAATVVVKETSRLLVDI